VVESRPDDNAFTFEGMCAAGTDQTYVAPGVAGRDVSTILITGDRWSVECPVEPRSGAFLAGADMNERIEITSLDEDRMAVYSMSGTTLWDAASELSH
jgi:hypothetical protein